MTTVRLLKVQAIALTPSYALHLAEWARERGIDPRLERVKRLLVAGEPGGGEPAMRARLEAEWNAQVTEAMGIGDISASLWGECAEQHGMHFSGRGYIHFELIDPDSGKTVEIADGAEGELVYTHLKQEGVPLLRFRSRDHVRIWTGRCACGRTAPRVRCIGRTDDMLIVRGVNVFPSALREVVNEFAPSVSGVIQVRPAQSGFRQNPPLRIAVEPGRQPRRRATSPIGSGNASARPSWRRPKSNWCRSKACHGAPTSRSWSTGRRPAKLASGSKRLQTRDFVLELQLAFLEIGDGEVVRTGMIECVLDLLLERLVAALKFGKVRFHGHQQGLLLTVRTVQSAQRSLAVEPRTGCCCAAAWAFPRVAPFSFCTVQRTAAVSTVRAK